jgi:hypothetical protein
MDLTAWKGTVRPDALILRHAAGKGISFETTDEHGNDGRIADCLVW